MLFRRQKVVVQQPSSDPIVGRIYSAPSTQPPVDQMTRKHSRGLKLFIWGLVILILGSVSWVTVAGMIAFRNISAKNSGDQSSFFRYNGDIPPDQLLGEGDSRINILSLGIDAAAGLTDSIQVISIDPVNKTLSMLAVPRDLYVMNTAENRKTKINEVYNSGLTSCLNKKPACDPNVDAGGELMKKTVSNLLGIKISYFTKIDFDGVKKIVDTLGGIQVNVDKPILDPFYPTPSGGYQTFRIAAGLQTMNGETALKYSRSRETTSDFDRARRQQQVISAIRQKGLKLDILANPKKVTDVINTVGHNFKTDLQSNELYAVLRLVTQIDSAKTTTKVLDDAPDGPLKASTSPTGQFILVPKAGDNDWSDVQFITETVMPEPYLIKESAHLQIVNATGRKTAGIDLKRKLTALGYVVIDVVEAKTIDKSSTISYATNKPYTLALLKRRFGLNPASSKSLPVGTDIIFTIGSSFTLK